MVKESDKEYLTVAEVAELLRISRASIYDYIKAGKLKGVRLRKRRLFSKAEIIEFLGEDPFTDKPREITPSPELGRARVRGM